MAKEAGDAEGVVVSKSKGSYWTQRIRIGKAAEERKSNPSRVSALDASVCPYADKNTSCVVNPGYKFCKSYSWETDFGVRYANRRLNIHQKKCMQEIVGACAMSS